MKASRLFLTGWRCLLALMIVSVFTMSAAAQSFGPINPAAEGKWGLDHDYDSDPVIVGPEIRSVFDPQTTELWKLALDRPDVETRRQAVMAIARAHAEKLADMKPLGARLQTMLDTNTHPVLRQALVRALATLDDPAAGSVLVKAISQPFGDIDVLTQADAALARWKTQDAGKLWLERMRDEKAPWPARQSAILALGAVGEKQAEGDLQALVNSNKAPITHRLTAARALARINTTGLVSLATTLAGDDDMQGRLLAVILLQHHSDAQAVAMLQRLATDTEPAVAQLAADRLLALSPTNLSTSLAARLLANNDAGVRLTTVRTLIAHQSTEAIALVAPALNDVNYDARKTVREGLAELSTQPALRATVVSSVRQVLKGDKWQGLEQAAYLVGGLDDESMTQRVVELLRHDRPEVRLAACVALRRLQVTETLPIALKRLEELHEQYKKTNAMERYGDLGEFSILIGVGAESTQLYQLLGRMKYAPAEPIMRKVIGKGSYDAVARGAAIWGLGLMHEGKPEEQLVRQFSSRLSDVVSMEPETTEVRMMSAISLGRMKAESALGTLRKFMQDEITTREIGGACRWAIMNITGETLPPLPAVETSSTDWFLIPLPK